MEEKGLKSREREGEKVLKSKVLEVLQSSSPSTPTKGKEVSLSENEKKALGVEDMRKAVETLKRAFPRHMQLAISKFAELQHLEEWQLVCGLITYCYVNALFSTPLIDSAWRGENPVIDTSVKCATCGKVFTPKRRKQIYCSSECGRKGAASVVNG